jgi:coproporphyrinogen III oxidase
VLSTLLISFLRRVKMLTDEFLIALKQKYINTIAQYNQDKAFEKKEWDFANSAGKVEVKVSRGKVFEKACISTIVATVTIPGRNYQSSIQWLGIQTFPANPLVPMFMGVFEHVSEKGEEHFPGFFDIYPTIPYDEDKEYLIKEMEAVAGKHGKSYQDLVEGYKRMFQVKEAGTGIGYSVGMAFRPEETDFTYFQDAASSIFQAYFHLVEKRDTMEPSPKQSDEMCKQRAEWVRFTFLENRFFQGGIKLGVPPESFMLHMLPPLVKF